MKTKSLAEESRIIKLEEQRAKKRGQRSLHRDLYLHRIAVVRVECRGTHLIRTYARWLEDPSWTLSRIEPNADKWCYYRSQAIIRAEKMAKNFGIDTNRFREWLMT